MRFQVAKAAAVFLAAIPVTAMLFIEVGLPYLKKRRDGAQTRRDIASTGEDAGATARRVAPDLTQRDIVFAKRWRQDGRYYRILHQTANLGNLASMDKLGEFALVRKDYVEAFYWRLMMELLATPSPGLSSHVICRVWMNAKCPEWHPAEGGLFTEKQARFARAVLDLWSERHTHASLEILRQMVQDKERDAILFARCFGVGEFES